MTAPALFEVASDPMAAALALNKMRRAGFALSVRDGRLIVKPLSRLSEPQRAYLRAHRNALLALLQDAAELHTALAQAGGAGLGWQEGMPDWNDARLLAAGEVLYADGRMTCRNDRRYLREHAPEPNADSLPGENAP